MTTPLVMTTAVTFFVAADAVTSFMTVCDTGQGLHTIPGWKYLKYQLSRKGRVCRPGKVSIIASDSRTF